MLTASQIWWTWEVEDAFRRCASSKTNLKVLASQQYDQVEETIKRVRGDLSANDRRKLMTLITTDMHSRGVVDRLVRDNITQVV